MLRIKGGIIIGNLTATTFKVGGYARLSKEDDNSNDKESQSISNQIELIKNYCEKNGYDIVDFYIDDGFSGGNFDRPSFKKMIDDIEKGLINMVITKDTSRLGRDFIGTSKYMFKYFPEHDVRYLAILEGFDTFNENGIEDFIPFQNIANDFMLKDTSRKVTAIRHQKMKAGLFVGSTVPYGYKRSPEDNRKFIVDSYAAPIVKRIFDMKLDGKSDCFIANKLTQEKILPPSVYSGKNIKQSLTTNMWKSSTVRNILRNDVYIGNLNQAMYKKVSYKSKKKIKQPRDKWIIIENNHEAIIDKDIFNRVNEMLKEKSSGSGRKYEFLLKGLVYCKECGKPMTVRRMVRHFKNQPDIEDAVFCCSTYANYSNYKLSKCSMHYNLESRLNPTILKEIRKIFSSYKNKENLKKKYDDITSNVCDVSKYKMELKINLNKISSLEKALTDLYVDKSNGYLSNDDFFKLKENMEKEKLEILSRNKMLNKMLNDTNQSNIGEKKRDKLINDFLKVKIPSKAILNQLINRIEIDVDKNIQIYFNFNLKGISK